MSTFDTLLDGLKKGAIDIAKTEGVGFANEIEQDGKTFLDAIRNDLETWTQQLAAGQLSQADFESLVRGEKDLAQMKALTAAGLAAARIDKVRVKLVDLVIATAATAVATAVKKA